MPVGMLMTFKLAHMAAQYDSHAGFWLGFS
jgi:hypothetical protein